VEIACTPGFWIDRYEVTNAEYREFLIATGYHSLPAGWRAEYLRSQVLTPDMPVVGVNTRDAEAYARWRGKRLPTPVEWLHATRGADRVLNAMQRDRSMAMGRIRELNRMEAREAATIRELMRRQGI
jgi:formylglycine-generating enzyme required for sulfatase activity